MSKKIAMIGAGSVIFCKTLMSDIMATPALADSEFALMSPTPTKLKRMEAFGKRMVKDNGLAAKVWATTHRQETSEPLLGPEKRPTATSSRGLSSF